MQKSDKRKIQDRINELDKRIKHNSELMHYAPSMDIHYDMASAKIEGLKTERDKLKELLE